MSAIEDRVRGMVSRGVVTATDPDRLMQEHQVELMADEVQDGVEHIEPYGFTSRPRAGAEALVLFPSGLRSHGVIVAVGDRRYRLRGLAEGEVAFHDDQGQSVKLGRDGIVITSAQGITIETEGDLSLSAEGAVSIEGESFTVTTDGEQKFLSDDIEIGNGAALYAARKTDAVTGAAISGGSSKVKIA